MTDITHPHDKFFKEVFSRQEVAADFLRNYLPEEVVNPQINNFTHFSSKPLWVIFVLNRRADAKKRPSASPANLLLYRFQPKAKIGKKISIAIRISEDNTMDAIDLIQQGKMNLIGPPPPIPVEVEEHRLRTEGASPR